MLFVKAAECLIVESNYYENPAFAPNLEAVLLNEHLVPLAAIASEYALAETTVKIFRMDKLFPDLYFVQFELDSATYRDYVKRKIMRTGLAEHEVGDIFGRYGNSRWLYEESPIDYSNSILHKGELLDMSSVPEEERFGILNDFSYDQLQKYGNLECVRSLNHLSTPTRKLQYPEPFIASPSFIHNDIGFIHVLHYQY